ncbi:MAG: endonuclease Q family protein, partial [bacterium]|nr:endonuclease Q family protein [bacterium]
MKFVADFHIHSKYSRATSPQMDLEHLNVAAKIKGIKVLGAADFSHPEWFKSLKEKLEPAELGLLKLKKQDNGTRFILTSEISCVYSKKGRVRKIHILIFAPSFEVVEKINAQLGWIGNLKSDGRPILGLDAKELAKIVLSASEDCLVVPAHLMTPWFSLFGSKSGFDSLEECFEEYSKYIFAGETGLSADPKMLWRMPDGRKITLISNSDAHSPAKLGREANVFDTELSYKSIIEAIKSKNPQKFLYTIEFFPEEGKYHF